MSTDSGKPGNDGKSGEPGKNGKSAESVESGKPGKYGKSGDSGKSCRKGRLDKILAQEGLGTRSELKKEIRAGKAVVNGRVEKDPGRQVLASDEVFFDGQRVGREQYVYYMLNKPAGVVSATEDGRFRTVLDLLREPGCPDVRSGTFSRELPARDPAAGGVSAAEPPDVSSGSSGLSSAEPPDPASAHGVPSAAEPPGISSGSSGLSSAELPDAASAHGTLSAAEPPDVSSGSSGLSPAEPLDVAHAESGAPSPGPVLRRGLFPVGRLDRDTEGLLLITDDGQLAHRLLSPKNHVDKVYYAVVTGRVTKEDIRKFAEGIRIGSGREGESFTALPADLKIVEREPFTAPFARPGTAGEEAAGAIPAKSWIAEKAASVRQIPSREDSERTQTIVTIREGKYHQIKRMFAAVGKEVLYLKRLSMGSLHLDPSLRPGEFRELTRAEKDALQ